jgi:pimeloyl-ACP methyl ester carboxylesterase
VKRIAIVLVIAAALAPSLAFADPGEITELAVSFEVLNINRSKVPCSSDGATYTVRGEIVAPSGALKEAQQAATLYLHGGAVGKWVWREPLRTEQDYAFQQALRGHVSILVDLLGYEDSGHPAGDSVCLGSEADVVHQIIGQLRSGAYTAAGAEAPWFDRVALAGHSEGGAVAQIEAYSFFDVDALLLFGWSDQPTGLVLPRLAPRWLALCVAGGEHVEDDGSGPTGYIYTWPERAQMAADIFFDPAPGVVEAHMPLVNRDPCGNITSGGAMLLLDNLYVPTIDVSTLLVFGRQDRIMPPPDGDLQKLRFLGSDDVTLHYIDRAGHSLMGEKTAPVFQATVDRWLCERGF